MFARYLPAISLIIACLLKVSSVAANDLHLDLEMPSEQLAKILERQAPLNTTFGDAFTEITQLGIRNLAWLNELNSHRAEPISLYRKDDLTGYPIEKPTVYGPSTLLADYTDIQNNMIPVLKDILFSKKSLPTDLPVSVDVYRKWAQQVDRLYQRTIRWKMYQPYLDRLATAKRYDVRGYYFLSQKNDLKGYLAGYASYSNQEQQTIQEWIVELCMNNLVARSTCLRKVDEAKGEFFKLASAYWQKAQANYQRFFDVPKGVRNYSTAVQNGIMTTQLRQTKDSKRDEFVRFHLEDEWNAQGLPFAIRLTPGRPSVQVNWVPNVTPHVPKLGADEIVMNANSSLDDWDTQWTIRHEFGHVLGLPDCYLEFYEADQNLIVGYQFDVNDLMCSRRGVLNNRIIQEMKSVYF